MRQLMIRWLDYLKLGPKIALMPLLGVLALVALGTSVHFGLSHYQQMVHEAETTERILALMRGAQRAQQGYLRSEDSDQRRIVLDNLDRMAELTGELHAKGLGRQAQQDLRTLKKDTAAYRQQFRKATKLLSQTRETQGTLVQAAATLNDKAAALRQGEATEAAGLQREARALQLATERYLRTLDNRAAEKMRKRIGELQQRSDKLAGTADSEQGRQRLEALSRAAQRYAQALDGFIETRERSASLAADMIATADKLEGAVRGLFEAEKTEQRAVREGIETSLIAITSLAALVLAVLGYLLFRGIVTSVERVSNGIHYITENNDLGYQIPVVGRDRLAEMASAVNELVGSQARILRELQEQSSQVASASEELSASSDEINRNAQSTAQRVDSVSNSAREVNDVVQDVANNIQDVSTSASNTSSKTREGQQAVSEAAQRMEGLKNASQRVTEIMETIQSIAKKTDLLALNAAIEAANAGEQGKGFAVVADEVRKLAEQTSEATGQVNDIVGELDGETQASVGAMEQVRNKMGEMEELIQHTDQSANQIAAAAEELAATMNETTDNMGEISSNVEQVTGSVREIQTAADQLNELASSLQSHVDRFRLGTP
jgi:methyl-accepting chemotaxis protein